MTSVWFLIIVFFTPSGHPYMDREMLPREAPSEEFCMNKAEQVRIVHAEIQTWDYTMNDAEIFCWEAKDISQLQMRLRKEFPRVKGENS